MKHIWSILCKQAVVDSDTNIISIFDVLEEIIAFPPSGREIKEKDGSIIIPIDFELVSYWVKENKNEKKIDILIEEHDPNNKIISSFEKEIPFPDDKIKMRTRIKTKGLKFTKSGEYSFRAKIKDGDTYRLVAEIPISVNLKISKS